MNHLALTARQYDVIISEPSNPWIAGIADLMTAEYFQLCHRRLAPGGIACVWLDAYTLDHESYRTVVRTFGSVFEQMSIWMTKTWIYFSLFWNNIIFKNFFLCKKNFQ